jgi:UDP-2,3-diacylglucosamine hydrolase
MSAVLISDLHLHESDLALYDKFERFLSSKINGFDNLFILGDLFETWIGDDNESEFNKNVIEILNKVSTDEIKVFLMHGNRDFLIGENFCSSINAELLSDYHIYEDGASKILLLHGDTLCTDDVRYQEFRKLVRDKNWRDDFLSKSLKERFDIASGLREMSNEETDNKKNEIMDVNQESVLKISNEFSIKKMIHGHTHRPFIHKDKNLVRVVLSDWENVVNYATVIDGEISLESF